LKSNGMTHKADPIVSGKPPVAAHPGKGPASQPHGADHAAFPFTAPGEMAQLCRDFDWDSTPLGPVAGWSNSLRTTVCTVLASRNPMFLWWGPDLVQIYNDAYRPSLGGDGRHPRALGAKAEEFWTDIWETIGPQIDQVMNGGDAVWHENSYIPIERNGRLEDVWWTYSYSAVPDDDGSIGGTLVVCLETTQQVLAQEQLRQSEARYRQLFQSLDEGFCVIEVIFDDDERPVDWMFVEVNNAFIGQTGLSDPVGKRVRELIPGHEEYWFEIYGGVAQTGESVRFEAPAEKLGRVYDLYAFRTGPASSRQVAVLFQDVTKARLAEQERDRLVRALKLERSRLAYVFEHAPAFLAVLRGADHVFELANAAYYQLIGNRDIVGKPLSEALPEAHSQGFAELLDRVLESGEPYVGNEISVMLTRSPGAPPERRILNFLYLPLIEEDGTRAGVIVHGTDVTEQVETRDSVANMYTREQQARASAEEAYQVAEAANRAKGEFLAVMSHELRTPLNAIGGYAELLEMGIRGPINAQQKEDLHRIQTSQRHLLGLINEVLNYAKLGTGTVHYDTTDVQLRDALSTAQSLVGPQARAKGLKLRIGECPEELHARCDGEKLQQILVNLLSNAVKFTDRNGSVELFCSQEGEVVNINVRDSGIGISDDKLGAIFDPFVQVRADLTRTSEGTGLGLAISRDLARGMKGDLTVTSKIGEGSTFTLTLPAGNGDPG
jgi:signal transduction histidine kinase